MTPKLTEYIEAGYALTPEERLEAARMLRLSVDQDVETERSEIDAEWDIVIERRVEEAVSGKVQLVSGRESFARIRARLDDLRV